MYLKILNFRVKVNEAQFAYKYTAPSSPRSTNSAAEDPWPHHCGSERSSPSSDALASSPTRRQGEGSLWAPGPISAPWAFAPRAPPEPFSNSLAHPRARASHALSAAAALSLSLTPCPASPCGPGAGRWTWRWPSRGPRIPRRPPHFHVGPYRPGAAPQFKIWIRQGRRRRRSVSSSRAWRRRRRRRREEKKRRRRRKRCCAAADREPRRSHGAPTPTPTPATGRRPRPPRRAEVSEHGQSLPLRFRFRIYFRVSNQRGSFGLVFFMPWLRSERGCCFGFPRGVEGTGGVGGSGGVFRRRDIGE